MITDKLGDITLYNADCMDVLRELPDNAFSLAIVDPPYGDANFPNPPHQAMNPDGGGRFDRYKRPMESLRSTIRPLQENRADCEHSRGDSRGINALPPHRN